MLASQNLISNKRNCSEYDSNAENKNQNRICYSHMAKSAAPKINVSAINSDCIANETSLKSSFNKAVMKINND